MISPVLSLKTELSADSFVLLQNSFFAFDFKKETYFIADIMGNTTKKIALSLIRDGFSANKVALCKNMPIFGYIDASESSAIVIDAQTSKEIRSFRMQDSKIESITINDSGDTILLGGKNGLLSRYQIYTGKLLDNVSRHKDFILLSKESQNRRFVISIGYDRSVVLYDKYKEKRGVQITTASSTIKCARFFDNAESSTEFDADSAAAQGESAPKNKNANLLALGDSSGYIYIINAETKQILHKFQAAFASIVDLWFYKDSYIFYLNGNGNIGVVDFMHETKILDTFMHSRTYRSFSIDGDWIILVGNDNEIQAFSFASLLQQGEDLAASGDVKAAYGFVAEFSFLESESFFLELEAGFEADTLEARAFACSGNQPKALEILSNYAEVPSKKAQIIELIAQVRQIDEFLDLMKSSQEVRAIPMALKNPLIRYLSVYMDYEARFQKILILAKELAKRGKKTEANTIMLPYKKIPNKLRAIQEVISYPQKVDEALSAIRGRDYKTFLRLKREYAFVSFFAESQALLDEVKMHHYKLLEAFYLLRFDACEEHIAVLNNFREYKDFVAEIELKIREAKKLIGILGAENFVIEPITDEMSEEER